MQKWIIGWSASVDYWSCAIIEYYIHNYATLIKALKYNIKKSGFFNLFGQLLFLVVLLALSILINFIYKNLSRKTFRLLYYILFINLLLDL